MKKFYVFFTILYVIVGSTNGFCEILTIEKAIRNFAEKNKGVRVAVFDFTNSKGQKTGYDIFISDTIITELSKYTITLLERKRLELLLKEHTLAQAGAVDSDDAIKLGKLLPVDIIISGSYTEFDDRIIINGRCINVNTGEIVYAFSSSIKNELTSNGSSSKNKSQITKDSNEADDKCTLKSEEIISSMSNLRTKEQINNAVTTAVQIPFSGKCGKIHYRVMHTFSRSNIYPESYRDFLIKTLIAIKDPSSDTRTREILRYFAADKHIDVHEWEAGVEVLKKTSSSMHIPMFYLINNKFEDSSLVKKRTEEIMQLAHDEKIGRPISVSEEKVFFILLHTLSSNSNSNDMENAAFIFKKYMHLISDNDLSLKRSAGFLEKIYFADKNRNTQKIILDSIIDFYTMPVTHNDILSEKSVDLLKRIELSIAHTALSDNKVKKSFIKDQNILNNVLKKHFCSSIEIAKKNGYKSQIEYRILYALKHGISCPLVPSLNDLKTDLESRDWDKKLKSIELLSKIDEGAAPLEKTIIKYLGQQGYESKGGKLRNLCAKTLGNIKSKDPQGIEMLIESFPDYDHGVSYEAEKAIEKIGIPALPFLIKGLKHQHHAVRLRCAKALGNLGRFAKNALPELEKLSNNDQNPYVKKQAQGAITMIKNDF